MTPDVLAKGLRGYAEQLDTERAPDEPFETKMRRILYGALHLLAGAAEDDAECTEDVTVGQLMMVIAAMQAKKGRDALLKLTVDDVRRAEISEHDAGVALGLVSPQFGAQLEIAPPRLDDPVPVGLQGISGGVESGRAGAGLFLVQQGGKFPTLLRHKLRRPFGFHFGAVREPEF